MKVKSRIRISGGVTRKEAKLIKTLSDRILDDIPNAIGVSVEIIYAERKLK